MTPVVTLFPFTLIGGIGSLTSLDFLGFGLQPPTPSWGELMAQGLNNLYAPWISVSTVAALFFTSGTTGDPKGVVHTHATLIDREDAILIARHAIVARGALIWPNSISAAQKNAAIQQLAERGVLVRDSA